MKAKLIMFLCIFYLIIGGERVEAGEVTLLKKFPVKEPLFTQGLEISKNKDLVLGTGIEGESRVGIFNLKSGRLDQVQKLPNDYFGEGLTFSPKYLWQLTWKEKKVLKRNPQNFKIIDEIPISTEGWGLCYDSDQDVIWRSDGTSTLYKHDPETFQEIGQIKISMGDLAASKLNELEYYNGHIYANRLYRDEIVKIDPKQEKVVDQYDIRPILDQTLNANQLATVDSLNGIAHLEGDTFYITGKLYPYIYEVKLEST